MFALSLTSWLSFSLPCSSPLRTTLPFTQISAAQQKTRTELKQLAKRNDVKSARILAREVVRSNKQVDRLHVSKARLNSVGMQLTHQAGASSPLSLSCAPPWR